MKACNNESKLVLWKLLLGIRERREARKVVLIKKQKFIKSGLYKKHSPFENDRISEVLGKPWFFESLSRGTKVLYRAAA